VAGLTAAADQLRERDREREVVLGRALVELGEARVQAEERAKRSEKAACRYWEAALAAVWTGSGLKMRPLPHPDRWADPADLDDLDARVERSVEELHHALHRKWRPRALSASRLAAVVRHPAGDPATHDRRTGTSNRENRRCGCRTGDQEWDSVAPVPSW